MATTQRSDIEAIPPYPMADLEEGSSGHFSAAHSSSASTSPSSPDETAHHTYPNNFGSVQKSLIAAKFSKLLPTLPAPLVRLFGRLALWIKGPQPPRQYKIKPFLERYQTIPVRLLDQWITQYHQKVWLLAGHHIFWLALFVVILRKSTSTGDVGGYGPPVRLSCTSRLW